MVLFFSNVMETKFPFKYVMVFFFLAIILLTSASVVQSRSISTELVSDGIQNGLQQQSIINLKEPLPQFCEMTYGFLPCTTTVLGNLFLIAVYGFLMFLAARYLSTASELLLEILGPGLVGGLFLPMLGSLPDSLLILVSGLSGSQETAQSQVLVGMGLLAGSAVVLLTLLWGSCVVVGKTDIVGSTTIDQQDTKGFTSTGSGVSVDIWTTYGARIMIISVLPFIVVQVPEIFHFSDGSHLAVLASLFVAVALLVSYCLYQVFQPVIQQRKLAFVKHKHVISGTLRHLKTRALGRLVDDDGRPNEDVIRKLFRTIDLDGDSLLSPFELRSLIIIIQFEEIDLDHDDAVQNLMKDFDTSGDNYINEDEFFVGISKWLNEAKRSVKLSCDPGIHTMTFLDHFHLQTKQEHDLLFGDHSDEVVESIEDAKWTTIKASMLLLLGVVIAGAFADPLVHTVNDFSTATGIPSFFISFIGLPLVMNSSEATSALMFASRKKKRTSSLTFSEIYGSVTIHNLLCLAVFLAIVYVRDLAWDFSAEVLIIVIVCIVMGLFASFRTIFPIWTCLVAYGLYPFSLVLVYVLDYGFGWS